MFCGGLIITLLYIGGVTVSREVAARPSVAMVNVDLSRPDKENVRKSWPVPGKIPMQSLSPNINIFSRPTKNDLSLGINPSKFQSNNKQWGKLYTKGLFESLPNPHPIDGLSRDVKPEDINRIRGFAHHTNKRYLSEQHIFPRRKRTINDSSQRSSLIEQELSHYGKKGVSEESDIENEKITISHYDKHKSEEALDTIMDQTNAFTVANESQQEVSNLTHRAKSNYNTDSGTEHVDAILDNGNKVGSVEVDKRSSQDAEDLAESDNAISSSESIDENNGDLDDDSDSEGASSDEADPNNDAQIDDKTPSSRHHLHPVDGPRNHYPASSGGRYPLGPVHSHRYGDIVNRTDTLNETTGDLSYDSKEMTTDPSSGSPRKDDHYYDKSVTLGSVINETESETNTSERSFISPTVNSLVSNVVSETRFSVSPNLLSITSTTSIPSTTSNSLETEADITSVPQEQTPSLLETLTTRRHILLGRSMQTTVISTPSLPTRPAFRTTVSSSTQAAALVTSARSTTVPVTNNQLRTTTGVNSTSTTAKSSTTTTTLTNSPTSQVPSKSWVYIPTASTLSTEPSSETGTTTTTAETTTITTTETSESTTEDTTTTTITTVTGGPASTLTTIASTSNNLQSPTTQSQAALNSNSTKVIPTIPERGDDSDTNENNDIVDRRYVSLKLSMATDEFCQSWDTIRQDLVVVLNWDEEDLVTTDQVLLIDGDTWCQEANEDTSHEDHIIIILYLVDRQRRYDRVLTTRCARYLSEGGPPLTSTSILQIKLMEAQLVRSSSIVPRHGGQPKIGGNTGSGNAGGTTKNGGGKSPGGGDVGTKTEYVREAEETGSDPGVIAAIVLAAIGVVCCLIVVALQTAVRRRHFLRQTLTRTKTRSPSVTSTGSIQLASVTKSRPNSGLFNPGLDIVDSMEPSHPMTYPQLVDFCSDFGRVSIEFEKLPNRMPRLSVVPTGEEEKNRFANILPLALTRVKLLQDGPEPRSSYINANYITGPDSQCQYYIATQAPTETTAVDFWTMVWQQGTKAIIMLTQLEEEGQAKCFPYWPDLVGKSAAQRHGDYLIELKQRDVHQEYIASQLEINNLPKIESRTVHHFWCTSWPSQGLPEPITLVKLVIDCRTKYEDSGMPVVVHCSPGTGRTGTYIALDLCMHQFETRRAVDIMKTVYSMRQERAGSVQTKEQYTLLYQAAREYASIIESPGISAASSATTLHALLPSS